MATEVSAGSGYDEFLAKYGRPAYLKHWQVTFDRVQLTATQRQLLESFTREMSVLCLAVAWCGDCTSQCPILEYFARAGARIHLRFLDRDEHGDLQQALSIDGGHRVPVVVFFSEDFHEAALYGDRILAQYRQLAREQLGPSCPTGIVAPEKNLMAAVTH